MRTRIITALLLFAISSNCLVSCNSEENNAQAEAKEQCNNYEYRYGKLQELVKAISTHSSYEYHTYDIWNEEAIQDIKASMSGLDTINCVSKKNLDFANAQISLIQEYLTREKLRLQAEALNGDDLFMSGVQISSSKILFDDNMNPFVETSISNNTNKHLKALKFLVNYCSRNPVSQLCYKLVLIKVDISPLSSKPLSFSLPKAIQMATDYPEVELVEILRSDGVKVKTAEGLRFSQQL